MHALKLPQSLVYGLKRCHRSVHLSRAKNKEELFSIPSTDPSVIEASRPATGVWEEFEAWRTSPVDERRGWLRRRPRQDVPALGALQHQIKESDLPPSLAACGALVLTTPDPLLKCELTHAAFRRWTQGGFAEGVGVASAPPRPARPEHPKLVRPREVPQPRDSPLPSTVYVLHNLAHIELNAVDLAWDTCVRYSSLGLPTQFYADFARVADDEARHFNWCCQRMQELGGYKYGDMVAHDILWQGAELSSEDLTGRLAVIPMTQEARGLDAGPRLALRLQGWGDLTSAAVVDRISVEEKAHVAVGVYWFQRICQELEIAPEDEFRFWSSAQGSEVLKGPFNDHARATVGLPQRWYNPELWPEEDRVRLRTSGTWDSKVATGGTASVPALSRGRDWAALRQRLAGMVADEMKMAV